MNIWFRRCSRGTGFGGVRLEGLYSEARSWSQSAACSQSEVDFLAGYGTFETNVSGGWSVDYDASSGIGILSR